MPKQINAATDFYVALEGDITGADATNDGTTSSNASISPALLVAYYNATLPTVSNGVAGALQIDANGRLIVAPMQGSLPAGTNNIGDVDVLTLPVDYNSGAAGATTLRSVLATRHEAAATPLSVRLSTGSAFDPTLTVTNTGTGTTADAAATSETGTFSLISLFKRLLSRLSATRLYVATTISTSGDNTVIAAPAAGTRIVITGIRIQNNTTTATVSLIKDGASTILARVRAATDGSGLSENYSFGDELRLTAATAFIINLSGANTHGVSVRYWLETISTGLPA